MNAASRSTHMSAALALARRGMGNTWPNPSVGCVIVRDGRVIGRGATAPGGRPHAEPQALAMAGSAARGATAFVSLEPCCFQGRSPPCTDALIAAGVARVVVGIRDPDARVNGAGIARLRDAGIEVIEGVMAAEAAEVVEGLISRITRNRPFVTLKLASSLDGRIATRTGESQWITGPAARRAAHALRGRHDAVLVGIGTVLADDPDLTCRIDGYKSVPTVRVVADSHLRLPLTSRLVRTADASPVWVLARRDADPVRQAALVALACVVEGLPPAEPGVDLVAGLQALAARGITRVLAEGGAGLAAALLRADLVDRIAWFHAPSIIGGDGLASVAGWGVETLAAMRRFRSVRTIETGEDILTELEPA
jgi:diaminohydroxyphosphoribosylaminopyrimidine deaminase/5-amino-6-(5-phosphoribosylamino)uracil reductase